MEKAMAALMNSECIIIIKTYNFTNLQFKK